ncbi:MAG: energy-coupling factor transporter transmembrane protein EcfT [Chloroflexota bacterium]|nr:MAG: energy-coupling factor transporter transmembrane protein EcfT [Chloroflexota bacterium]
MAIEYQKGTSVLHRLDARTKLLMFVGVTLLSVIIIDPIIMGAIFLGLYYLGTQAIDRKVLNRNLRVLVVIFSTFALFQIIFFTPSDSYFLFYLIPGLDWIPVTVQGLIRGVAVFFRFFSVVLSVHLMLYTTPPVDLALSITKRERTQQSGREITIILLFAVILLVTAYLIFPQQIQRIPLDTYARILVVMIACILGGFLLQRLLSQGLPAEMGIALTLGFATVGLLSQQTQKITDAQKARGYDVQPKNLARRVQVLTALLLPIFLATLERSQDISIAILARGFDYNISARTYRRQLIFHRIDYIAMGVILALLLGALLLNYFGIGNPTEQLIMSMIGK